MAQPPFLRHEFVCARTEPCAGWRRFRHATGQDGRHGDILAGEKSEPARFPNSPEKVGIRVGCRRSQIGGSDVSFSLVLIDCITQFHAVAAVAQNSIGVAQN
jgi:hypothetical protein